MNRTELAAALRKTPQKVAIEAAIKLEQDEALIESLRKTLDDTLPCLRSRIDVLEDAVRDLKRAAN